MHTYSLFGLALASDVPFIRPLRAGAGQPDLTFTCQAEPPFEVAPAALTPTRSTRQTDERLRMPRVLRTEACDVVQVADDITFYIWHDRIICHLSDPARFDRVEMYFLAAALPYWMEQRGIPVLHASSVVVDGQALGFMARSRMGKSALAATFVQQGALLLSDDPLVVRMEGESVVAYPGVPQMRMWADQAQQFLGYSETLPRVHPTLAKRFVPISAVGGFCKEPQPLTRLYLLDRQTTSQDADPVGIKVLAVAPTQALFQLVNNSYIARTFAAREYQQRRLALLAPLAERVTVRRLVYPSGYEHLRAVREAILRDLNV